MLWASWNLSDVVNSGLSLLSQSSGWVVYAATLWLVDAGVGMVAALLSDNK